ncbi:MAG: ATP synthase F1 subunit gamma [Planctomycetota bacterium]|nr:ATP synthase F1 subunit gamma [Planctomycetaceae bacterium]MDQ3331311.1 ATP synthase F1 subunit gamma [Planctomycetota bacterium]
MAKARAIVKRLKAIKNIRKITRTMELIATARFKKAMDRASQASAYTKKISEIVADIARTAGGDSDEMSHPLLRAPEATKNATLLVITSNRGLAGGYNGGILRGAIRRMKETREAGATLKLEVAGKRGISYMRFQAESAEKTYTNFDDRPGYDEVERIADRYIEEYISGRLDRLDVAYMKFVSASRQTPVVETLLPIGNLATDQAKPARGRVVDYELLPSAQEILKEIVPAAFKARLFKCFLDAAVSEQIARMVAMKGATENADEIIGNLSQKYNRARQSQITSELAEIIGGAAALE